MITGLVRDCGYKILSPILYPNVLKFFSSIYPKVNKSEFIGNDILYTLAVGVTTRYGGFKYICIGSIKF
jgi:hypothetical protein